MRKIIPLIGIDASYRAFCEANRLYNEQVDFDYARCLTIKIQTGDGRTRIARLAFELKYGVIKPHGAKLTDTHYTLFRRLLRVYRDRIDSLPAGVNEFFPNEMLGLWLTRGDIASRMRRSPKTAYNLLERLVNLGFLTKTNHGEKKPIEIRFAKDILVVFDKKAPNSIPDSKFLTLSFSDHPYAIGKKLPNNDDVKRTLNNNTITSGVSVQVSNFGSQIGNETAEIVENTYRTASETVFPTATPNADGDFLHGTQQTGNPEQKSQEIPKSWSERVAQNAKKRTAGADFSQGWSERVAQNAKKVKEKAAGAIALNLEPLPERRAENLSMFAGIFTDELLRRIFPNRYFTPEYKAQIVDYVKNNYFSDCETKTKVENRYQNNLLPRILIAEDYLKKFKRPDGKLFDTTYFFPLAYLNVETFGNAFFSFRNTAKLLEKHKTYEKLNGYNRKITPELRKSLNSIYTAFQHGRIDYEEAKQRVKSLSIANNTDEPIKQFFARCANAGIYTKKSKQTKQTV